MLLRRGPLVYPDDAFGRWRAMSDVSAFGSTGIMMDQPQLPRFKAYTNYDSYTGVGTWTKIGINATDDHDHGAFDAARSLFTAPANCTYLFGATLLYKLGARRTPSAQRPPGPAFLCFQ